MGQLVSPGAKSRSRLASETSWLSESVMGQQVSHEPRVSQQVSHELVSEWGIQGFAMRL